MLKKTDIEIVNNGDEFRGEQEKPNDRRKLFPWWIKFFIWMFMIFGLLIPVVVVLGMFGMSVDLELYGMETTQPFSIIGLILIMLFTLKGIASYGMWTRKDWAIKIAKIDAIIGIIICTLTMCVLPFVIESFNNDINFRLELVLLIPYLIKLVKIEKVW